MRLFKKPDYLKCELCGEDIEHTDQFKKNGDKEFNEIIESGKSAKLHTTLTSGNRIVSTFSTIIYKGNVIYLHYGCLRYIDSIFVDDLFSEEHEKNLKMKPGEKITTIIPVDVLAYRIQKAVNKIKKTDKFYRRKSIK